MPVIIPHYMRRDLQWYSKLGMAGISTYAEPGDWLTYELNHYTLARLAWDPNADVDAIISDFCISRFPKCAGAARKAYSAMENTVRHACGIPFTGAKSPAELLAAIERLNTAKDALIKASGNDTSIKPLIASMDYALRDIAIQKQISEGGSAAERKKMVDDLVEFLADHKGEGIFLTESRLGKDNLYRTYDVTESGKKQQ